MSSFQIDNEASSSLLQGALKGNNLYKTYSTGLFFSTKKKHYILDDLSINIAKAKIILDVNSGEILIDDELKNKQNQFGLNLNKLGYMPQNFIFDYFQLKETCLFSELKINEILFYFGKLHNMNKKEIKLREDFLVQLLNLPNSNSLICNLSGGQARRTSLAVALFHQPKILILDEPTVGMDPILRKKIWNYLVSLTSNEKTTIIITTHYIEEAREANCLGFMRHGKIIEENKPEILMQKYENNILEEVFYSICVNSQLKPDEDYNENTTLLNNKDVSTNNPDLLVYIKNSKTKNCHSKKQNLSLKNYISSSRTHATIFKDTLKCLRNIKLLFIQFIVPIIQVTFFCLCIGRPVKNLPIGYINNELSDTQFSLGKFLINELDNQTLNKKEYLNFKDGYSDLKQGYIWCLIEIDRNFSQDISNYYQSKTFPKNFSNLVHIYMDNTNHQISYAIKDSILKAVKNIVDFFIKLNQNENYKETNSSHIYSQVDYEDEKQNEDENENEDQNQDENNTHESLVNQEEQNNKNMYPIIFEKPVYGENEPIFTNFMAPGVALSVIFFISVASTASNFEFERRVGLTERAYLSGLRTIELLLSQLIVYSILMVIQVFLILVLLFVFLKLPLKGSIILLIILLFSQGFCGLSYGLSLASIFHGEETVIQVTLASFYPVLLMSGIIWPLEAQPDWLKNFVSQFLPLTYATDSFRAILEKDWNIANFNVMKGFLATYAWTIIFLVVFLFMFSHRSSFKN
nr:ATP-binding cassette transporter Abch-like2 [Brachionus angularis]